MCKDNTSKEVTQLILHEKNVGLFVAIISSKDGNCSHAVGIDAGSKLIYDCMEDNLLQLNEKTCQFVVVQIKYLIRLNM